MSSCVHGLEIEKTTFACQLRDPQYDYDGTLAEGRKASDTLKKLHASVEEFRRHAKLFCTKVPIHNDPSKIDLCERFAAFWTPMRDSSKELVKKHDLDIK